MAAGEDRFAFGANWKKFIAHIDEERIQASIRDLRRLIQEETLDDKAFLDIGCGSGLSSLAAHRLGARVHSFDYDPNSVAATTAVRDRFAAHGRQWVVEQGSALDDGYMRALGCYDIVYSWGVLHHTGDMWRACDLAAKAVRDGGKLALAIYNDQGGASRRWSIIKRCYVRSPMLIKAAIVALVGLFFEGRAMAIRMLRLQNPLPLSDWRKRRNDRGMSVFHDLIDWVGGYPFEVAKPEEVFCFFRRRGFILEHLKTCGGGHGCNEFMFRKSNGPQVNDSR